MQKFWQRSDFWNSGNSFFAFNLADLVQLTDWQKNSTFGENKIFTFKEKKYNTLPTYNNTTLPSSKKSFFLKMGQSRPLFVYFRLFTLHNLINWWKRRWCAWDSNPRWLDGSHRQIHWAMAAPQEMFKKTLFAER